MSQEQFTENDVAQLNIDIVLETTPTSPILRHEQLGELVNLMATTIPALQSTGVGPEVIMGMLSAIFKASALQSDEKREFVKLLTPKPPDPQQQQQAMAMQQRQMQLALAEVEAKVVKLQGEAAKAKASADKTQLETQVAVQASAQLTQAQAIQAESQARMNERKGPLIEAQTLKAAAEAEATSEQVPGGTGGTQAS